MSFCVLSEYVEGWLGTGGVEVWGGGYRWFLGRGEGLVWSVGLREDVWGFGVFLCFFMPVDGGVSIGAGAGCSSDVSSCVIRSCVMVCRGRGASGLRCGGGVSWGGCL